MVETKGNLNKKIAYQDCYIDTCIKNQEKEIKKLNSEEEEFYLEEAQLFYDCVQSLEGCKQNDDKFNQLLADDVIPEEVYKKKIECYVETKCQMPDNKIFKNFNDCQNQKCMVIEELEEVEDFLMLVYIMVGIIAAYIVYKVFRALCCKKKIQYNESYNAYDSEDEEDAENQSNLNEKNLNNVFQTDNTNNDMDDTKIKQSDDMTSVNNTTNCNMVDNNSQGQVSLIKSEDQEKEPVKKNKKGKKKTESKDKDKKKKKKKKQDKEQEQDIISDIID